MRAAVIAGLALLALAGAGLAMEALDPAVAATGGASKAAARKRERESDMGTPLSGGSPDLRLPAATLDTDQSR